MLGKRHPLSALQGQRSDGVPMTWIDVAVGWRSKTCIVCSRPTGLWVAPLGIVSGRVRCHDFHDNESIMRAWFRWLDARASVNLPIPELMEVAERVQPIHLTE